MYKGVFITGTDTGVGKTIVSAGIGLELKSRGIDIGVMKPVSSGEIPSSDAKFLMAALNIKDNIKLVNPIAMKYPLAPYVSSQIEKRKIEMNEVFASFKKLQQIHKFIIVEGIGGVLVPILKKYFVVDMIRDFKLPAIIVARAGLGTINHTLMTIKTLEQRKIKVIGIIINQYTGNDLSEKTNPSCLEKISGYPVLAKIKELKGVFQPLKRQNIRLQQQLQSVCSCFF